MQNSCRARLGPLCLALSVLLGMTLAASRAAWGADTAQIASALQPFVDDHTLPGAVVLVADKENILDLEAVGYADVAKKLPMRPDSLFWIASMSKPITTTLLMMLVDDGKVNVDDPVEKYIPEFKDVQVALSPASSQPAAPGGAIQGFVIKEDKFSADHGPLRKPIHPITVRNLLTHTSGLSKVTPPDQVKDKDLVPLGDAVAGYAKIPLLFEPGSKYDYSNHGMNTVGRIIEVASGMSYWDFMEQRLLKPLGMKDTTFWPDDEQYQRLAKGYIQADAEKHVMTEAKPLGFFTYPLSNRNRAPFPAGGLFSTASDLSLFCRMLLNGGQYDGHRYLSMKSLQEMTSTQTGDLLNQGRNEDGYGFGWQTARKLRPTDKGLACPFGHGGAYGTEMSLDPSHSLITIFMVQFEGGMKGEAARKIKSAFKNSVHEEFEKPGSGGVGSK